ncbi:MAG: ABC transporter permease, partial [Hylemonella sp.]|nr:ABC transporter permease [Hylemonella sp.]
EQMSDMILSSEIKEQKVFGTVLPSIFLGVAAFLLNVVLGRQIATQREQIAALKALGYDNAAIAWHYLKLVLFIVVLGMLVGLGLGTWLGHAFMGLYEEVFRFPELRYRVHPLLVLAAAGLTLLAALGATWQAIAATVRLAPAEAMRPPAPGRFRPSVVEHWGLRPFLSPAVRMVLRTMQRRPLRTALTTAGVAASMAIIISGTFWRDTIDLLLNTQFRLVLRGDVVLSLVEATPARVLHEVARLPQVTAAEGARNVAARLVHGPWSWRGAVQGRNADPQLQRVVDVAHQVHQPPVDGLLLTDRLAERLHVRPGDTVRVEVLEGRRQVLELPVAGTVQEMMGMGAYIERRSLNRLLQEGDLVNVVAVSANPGHEPELLEQLKRLPRVGIAFSKSVMLRNMEEITARNVLVFSAILTMFASIIAVGVVYNHARIALAERAWELASLRVLGFTRGEVSTFLLGELALEILLAIPLGLLAGYGLAAGIVQLIKTDEFFFPLYIQPPTYAYAAITVVVSGIASALIVRRRIDKLDLVGVLKTRE